MPILSGDIKLVASQVMDDVPEGGGAPTSTIIVDGTSTNTWISRALCDTLKAWAALPGVQFDLVLRGITHPVIFDHAQGGFSAQAIWRLADGAIDAELMYRPTFKFLKV